jgi:hypothetical protein
MADARALTIQSGRATEVADADSLLVGAGIDRATAGSLTIGGTTATAITIGSSGVSPSFPGGVDLSGSDLTLDAVDIQWIDTAGALHTIDAVQAANDTVGSGLDIRGGQGGNSSIAPAQDGGGVLVQGGAGGAGTSQLGGDGGDASLVGGTGGETTGGTVGGTGGAVYVTGGAGGNGGTSGNTVGGSVFVNGGAGQGSGADGSISIGTSNTAAITIGASGVTTTIGDDILIQNSGKFNWAYVAGEKQIYPLQATDDNSGAPLGIYSGAGGNASAGAAGAAGYLRIEAGYGGSGTGALAAGAGGHAELQGGDAGSDGGGGGAVGGNVSIWGGSGSGGESDGVVYIGTATTSAINIGAATTSSVNVGGGTINIGTATGSAVNLARSGITTTVGDDLTIQNSGKINWSYTAGEKQIYPVQAPVDTAGMALGIYSGAGGNASAGAAGAAGYLRVEAGYGGDGTGALAAGAGGHAELQGGDAGSDGGGGGAVGGNVSIWGGSGSGGESNGVVYIGTADTFAVHIGSGLRVVGDTSLQGDVTFEAGAAYTITQTAETTANNLTVKAQSATEGAGARLVLNGGDAGSAGAADFDGGMVQVITGAAVNNGTPGVFRISIGASGASRHNFGDGYYQLSGWTGVTQIIRVSARAANQTSAALQVTPAENTYTSPNAVAGDLELFGASCTGAGGTSTGGNVVLQGGTGDTNGEVILNDTAGNPRWYVNGSGDVVGDPASQLTLNIGSTAYAALVAGTLQLINGTNILFAKYDANHSIELTTNTTDVTPYHLTIQGQGNSVASGVAGNIDIKPGTASGGSGDQGGSSALWAGDGDTEGETGLIDAGGNWRFRVNSSRDLLASPNASLILSGGDLRGDDDGTGIIIGHVGTGDPGGSALQTTSFTTTERDYLVEADGMVVYNETDNQLQGRVNGSWVNLGYTGGATGGGWTDDGTVVRLTTASDTVAIGTATMSGSEKLRVVGDILLSGTGSDLTFSNDVGDKQIYPLQSADNTAGRPLKLFGGQGGDGNAAVGGAGGVCRIEGGFGGDDDGTNGAGAGGDALLIGGSGGADSGGGGAVGGIADVQGGAGTGTESGGDVRISGGSGTPDGSIVVGHQNTASITLGNATDNTTIAQAGTGQVTFTGNVNATNGLDVTNSPLTLAGPGNSFSIISGATVDWNIADDDSASVQIDEGGRNYLTIDTSNGAEEMLFGNGTTNPDYTFQGSGQVSFAGNVDANAGLDATGVSLFELTDNTANAFRVKQGTNVYFDVTTTDSAESLTIGTLTPLNFSITINALNTTTVNSDLICPQLIQTPDMRLVDGVGTAANIDLTDGDSAAVSAANHGRIRYNETTDKIEKSENTGAYAPINAPDATIVEDATTTTTTSATDAQMANMTATPVAGTYLVHFQGSVDHNTNNAITWVSIYAAGTQAAASEREAKRGASQGDVTLPFACMAIVTVNGAQAIQGMWRTDNATATCYEHQLMYMRVA